MLTDPGIIPSQQAEVNFFHLLSSFHLLTLHKALLIRTCTSVGGATLKQLLHAALLRLDLSCYNDWSGKEIIMSAQIRSRGVYTNNWEICR